MGAFDARIPATILSLLAFLFFVTSIRQENTEYGINLLRKRSATAPQLVERASGNYVLLQTEYALLQRGDVIAQIYTNVTFGNSNQLKLSVWPSNLTWVPGRPASISDFCNESNSDEACAFAETSGYYTPAEGSASLGNFSFRAGELGGLGFVGGYYMEDTVTAGGVTVDLEFGIATRWGYSPTLGLGFEGIWFPSTSNILPGNSSGDTPPSYLNNLRRQGKIASSACSFYNAQDPSSRGQILLGAVDRSKFYGPFDVYPWAPALDIEDDFGGRINAVPTVRLGDLDNPTNLTGPYLPLEGLTAQVNPFYGNIGLPANIYNPLIDSMRPFGIIEVSESNPTGQGAEPPKLYLLPCDTTIPPQYVLEFMFDKVAIKIPFDDLVYRGFEFPDSPGMCGMIIFQLPEGAVEESIPLILGGVFVKYAYFVINPETRTTAIAALSRNDTANEIVEIGGPFGGNLMNLRGNGIDPSTSNPSNPNKLPVGAQAGIGVGGALLVIGAIGLGYFLYRRKKARKAPGILSSECPSEADSKPVPFTELEAPQSQAPVLQDTSSNTGWQQHSSNQRHELDASTGLLHELP
ncbi:hypothetical protein TWF506_008133 [Arthrobotrys conoides]|uniref:Peptidase A1 domain-containing protein n=1 Tax=Arthrobotrys conoides TaxID=74498 RepID=A0AAN8RRS1_9PEZI